MKVMSFNTQHCLNYIEQKIDYDIMAKAILDSGADIIGLNEIRGYCDLPDYDDQTGILSKLTGITNSFFAPAIKIDGVAPYGNGFLSKIPIKSAEKIMIPDPEKKEENRYYETRCIIKAVLENGFTVLVTHFGLNGDEQKNAVDTLIKNIEPEKCILMGDFNVSPDDPVLTPIRNKMKDTADLFNEPLLSFPSDKPRVKIDYIFVSPDVEVLSADIPAVVAADHRPHVCVVNSAQ